MLQEAIIIFVCEHGAAKSIIAAAYFNKVAGEKGLAQRAIARGTVPAPELSQITLAGLVEDGLTPTETSPKKTFPSGDRDCPAGDCFLRIIR